MRVWIISPSICYELKNLFHIKSGRPIYSLATTYFANDDETIISFSCIPIFFVWIIYADPEIVAFVYFAVRESMYTPYYLDRC